MKTLPFLSALLLFCVGCTHNDSFSKASATRSSGTFSATRHTLPNVKTTAYCHLEDGVGRNAIGGKLTSGHAYSASADWSRYPLGTVFRVAETGRIHVVDDYGPALVGTDTIDLYVSSLSEMHRWGVRRVRIDILKEGSYTDSLQTLAPRQSRGYVRKMVQSLKTKVS